MAVSEPVSVRHSTVQCSIRHLVQLLYKPLLAVPTSCFNKVPHIGIHIISYPRSLADK
jgi:hypothetical protein